MINSLSTFAQQLKSMKLSITKIEPNKFERGLVINSKKQQIQLTKQKLIIGRGECLEQEKSNKVGIFCVNHQSISRKHASISIPFYLAPSNKEMVRRSMKTKANELIPKFYSKLGGFWGQIPQDLLLKIREYSKPEQIVLISNMNSRFGLYRKVEKLRITHKQWSHNITKAQKYNIEQVDVAQNSDIILQMGNQPIKIKYINFNLNKVEMEQRRKFLQASHKNIEIIQRVTIQPHEHNYSMIVMQQLCHQQGQENSLIGIVMCKKCIKQQKVAIGRNSTCDIQISKSSLSRKQAYIYVDEHGNWIIQDASSTNGTWLKCQKIKYSIQQNMVDSISVSQQETSHNEQYDNQAQNKIQNADKMLRIKLGQVRLDISVENIASTWKQTLKSAKYGKDKHQNDYTRILADISDLQNLQKLPQSQEDGSQFQLAKIDIWD